MGVATGCCFKEIYRFPHTTYPYSSCICTFWQQHPYFFFHFVKMILRSLYIYLGLNIVFTSHTMSATPKSRSTLLKTTHQSACWVVSRNDGYSTTAVNCTSIDIKRNTRLLHRKMHVYKLISYTQAKLISQYIFLINLIPILACGHLQ